jgi:hypothetical protein
MLPAPTFKPGQQTTFSFKCVITHSIRKIFQVKSNEIGGAGLCARLSRRSETAVLPSSDGLEPS